MNIAIDVSAAHLKPVGGVPLELVNVEAPMVREEVVLDNHFIVIFAIIIILVRGSITNLTIVHPATYWILDTFDKWSQKCILPQILSQCHIIIIRCNAILEN